MESKHCKNITSHYTMVFCILLSLIGCDNGITYGSNFEGEYEMKTQIIAVYQDNTRDTVRTELQTPISIYKDRGKWYVSTYYFGVPNYNLEEPIYMLKSPQKMQSAVDSVENVTIENLHPLVALSEGLIGTYYCGCVLAPKPIPIKSFTSNSITFNKSDEFNVSMVDVEGNKCDDITCIFDYKPLNKIEDFFTYYTWEVNLLFENTPSITTENQLAGFKYQNTLRKQ